MLPDGSAEALLAEGMARGADAPPWVVFSAGVPQDRHETLVGWGVARVLRKPVPLAELLDTVAELLAGRDAGAPAAAIAVPAGVDPVQQHFGGDRVMYESFRAGCLERFAEDLAQGNVAVASGDAPALRRVVHGLKAVLDLLGQPGLAEQARVLEMAAAAWTPGRPLPEGWARLSRAVAELRRQR